jgi:hypothetical protein
MVKLAADFASNLASLDRALPRNPGVTR